MTVQVGHLTMDPLDIKVGVKQGYILTPVIFNIFLLAVTDICHTVFEWEAGVNIQYRVDGSLFNLRGLQTHTKISLALQYANDCAIVAHDPNTLQRTLDVFASAYTALGSANTHTQKNHYLKLSSTCSTTFFSNKWRRDKVVERFTYLGSTLDSYCSTDYEIQLRTNYSFSACGCVRQRVFNNNNLKVSTKSAVNHYNCVSKMLYRSET